MADTRRTHPFRARTCLSGAAPLHRYLANRNYARGRAAEYRARRQLESEGWTCVRAAGSHGPVDLVAFKDGRVRCIQVKTGAATVSAAERDALLRLKADLPASATVEVWRSHREPEVL